MIDQNRLRSILNYDVETGLFTWATPPRGKSKGSLAGGINRGYLRIGIDGRLYMAHRLAWLYVYGELPDGELDHANGSRSDNRLCNLRLATRSQNCVNKRLGPVAKSGFRGVYFNKKSGKWIAQIGKDGRRSTIGYFDTPEAASEAYISASTRLHGEFFPTTQAGIASGSSTQHL